MKTPDLQVLASTWRVVLDGPPYDTTEGVLAFGTRDDTPVVLKTLGTSFDAEGSAMAQTCFDGHSGVKVLESVEGACLLQRVMPGHTLTEAMAADEMISDVAVFATVAQSLHTAPVPNDDVPNVHGWSRSFATWREEIDSRLPVRRVREAEALFHHLIETTDSEVLLHGDLHHANILYDANGGWLTIDPKGVVGDPAFEAAAFLRNPMRRLNEISDPEFIRARVAALSSLTSWKPDRIYAWAYCQNVLSAIWDAQDGIDIEPMIGFLNAVKPSVPKRVS